MMGRGLRRREPSRMQGKQPNLQKTDRLPDVAS
jgi:hypothetical protein